MKWTNYFLIFLLFLISCTKNDDENASCITLSITPQFQLSNFKKNYNIQMPSYYTGQGMTTTSMGNRFLKKYSNLVTLRYNYCDSVSCPDFGEILPSPEPEFLEIIVDTTLRTLDKKIRFCEHGNTLGILYYDDVTQIAGRLYWFDDGMFKEALEVFYNAGSHVEVLDILKTIKKK